MTTTKYNIYLTLQSSASCNIVKISPGGKNLKADAYNRPHRFSASCLGGCESVSRRCGRVGGGLSSRRSD